MRDHGLKANQIAILGDQMYTDILGGNIWGFYTILTAPIAIKDRNITKVFRFFEELIYGYLEKKKILYSNYVMDSGKIANSNTRKGNDIE